MQSEHNDAPGKEETEKVQKPALVYLLLNVAVSYSTDTARENRSMRCCRETEIPGKICGAPLQLNPINATNVTM